MFQGVTFVIFYVGAIQYLHTVVPQQWKSTGQTVLTVVFFGSSGIVGSSLGGWLMDEFGGAVLYRIMALFAGVCVRRPRTDKVRNKLLEPETSVISP